MTRPRSVVALAFLGCVIASCSSTLNLAPASHGGGEPPFVNDACAGQTPPATPTPAASASTQRVTAVKVPLRGLIDLGQVSADNMHEPPYNAVYYACKRQQAISGIVVNDTWADLQPGGAESPIDTRTIDRALQNIAQYDHKAGRSLAVRLRVWAGIDAPNWAKSIGGAPILICDGNAVPASPTPSPTPASSSQPRAQASPTPCPAVAIRTVGRFWSAPYEAAWRAVQYQLAKKYDAGAAVNEVTVSSCSSLTSEPFVQSEDAFSRDSLESGGYTDLKYQQCLANAIPNDYALAWHATPVAYSFNPFRMIQVTPPQTNLAFTEAVIDGCRAVLHGRCVLLNEALAKFTPPPSTPAPSQTPSTAQSYYAMWKYMRAKGGAITFQTASPPNLLAAWGTNVAGWNSAVHLGAQFGASSIELFPPERFAPCTTPPNRLWFNGYTCFKNAAMQSWKNELEANP